MARELTESASTLPNVTAPIYEMDESASKAARLAATFAIAHAILAGLSLYLIQSRTPGVDASSEEILAYFQDEQDRRMVLLTAFYLIPFAAISFIWFINAFRAWIQRKTGITRSVAYNVQLFSSVGYVILTLATAAALAVTPSLVEFTSGPYDDTTVRMFPLLGQVLFIVMAMKLVSMTAMTTSSIGRGTGILPNWFNWLSLAAGIVLILVPTISNWLFLVFVAWLVVLAVLLFKDSTELVTPNSVAT